MFAQKKYFVPLLLRGLLSKLFHGRFFVRSLRDSQKKISKPDVELLIEISNKDNREKVSEKLSKAFINFQKIHNKFPEKLHIPNVGTYSIMQTISEKEISDSTENIESSVKGRIVFIAGAAQNIGAELTRIFIEKGCFVFIGDVNYKKAKEYSNSLCREFGYNCAESIPIDVTSEKSIQSAMEKIILFSGGIDVLICNVAIFYPGEIDTFPLDEFIKMTNVNYVGYFLMIKHFAPLLKIQNSIHGNYMTDIIQTNSKTGLEGSAKNSAYAGSKFGGIGLTRSLAHELMPFNIKVNAVCPGNYYDGHSWSNPKDGMFIKYLKLGRVPGAKTISEVRRYYEQQSPIHRGVVVKDIAKAIIYIIEQQYETGQAVPVAGGQIMLH